MINKRNQTKIEKRKIPYQNYFSWSLVPNRFPFVLKVVRKLIFKINQTNLNWCSNKLLKIQIRHGPWIIRMKNQEP